MKITEIRKKLQTRLKDKGVNFIKLICDDSIDIIETQNVGTGKLEKVIITGLQNPKFKYVWKIPLENKVKGFTTGDQTTEVALLIWPKDENTLYVYLIEMKTCLGNKRGLENEYVILKDIIGKFSDTISRIYHLLLINDEKNCEGLALCFIGVIFFNTNKIKDNDGTKIYQILKGKDKIGWMECQTFLEEKEKMPIIFYENPGPNTSTIEVDIENLLKKVEQAKR